MQRNPVTALVAVLSLALVASFGITAVSPSGAVTSVASSARAGVPASAHTVATSPRGTMTSRIVGTAGRHDVRGTFVPLRFVQRGRNLAVRGVVHGVVRRPTGPTTFTVVRTIRVRSIEGVRPGQARTAAAERRSCDVLNLVLGPLDLDLLGLTVNLNRVVLDVVAVTGAGKLLGNLLCAVVGLLDGPGLLGRLTTVLNRILALLRLGG